MDLMIKGDCMRITRPTRQPRSLIAVLLAALLLATIPPGSALAEQEPTNEELAEAYYEQGVEAYFNQNFPLAITYLQRAHALDPDPVVLYNISLAHSRLGNTREALRAALQAEEMGGMPEDTALKNMGRIRAFQLQVTAEEITQALAPPEAPQAQLPTPPSTPSPLEPPPAIRPLGWIGIGTAGAGALALAGAGVLTLIVGDQIESYNSARQGGDYNRALEIQEQIGNQQLLGQILLYSGAGLFAVGGTLWAIDFFGNSAGDTPAQLSLSGSASPERATLQLRLNF